MNPDRIDLGDEKIDPLEAWANSVCSGLIDIDDPQVTIDLQFELGPMGAERAVGFTEAVMRSKERKYDD